MFSRLLTPLIFDAADLETDLELRPRRIASTIGDRDPERDPISIRSRAAPAFGLGSTYHSTRQSPPPVHDAQ